MCLFIKKEKLSKLILKPLLVIRQKVLVKNGQISHIFDINRIIKENQRKKNNISSVIGSVELQRQ